MSLAATGRHVDGDACGPASTAQPGWSPRDALVAVHGMRAVSMMLEVLQDVLPQTNLHVTDGTDPLGTLLASARPALVLVDLNLIDYSVRDLITQARTLNSDARIVAVLGHGDDDRVLPALRCGAAGFLLKHNSRDEVVAQLNSIIAGVLPLTPALARHAIRHLDQSGLVRRVTGAELELLRWISLGDTPAEAAWRLQLERSAVARHARHVFDLLGLPATADV